MNSRKPPKIAKRVLLSFLRPDLREEVLGDLEENFGETLRQRSLLRARLDYWFQVLNYLRPFAFRKRPRFYNANARDMYKNYLTIAWRNLIKNRMHSFLNITGLSVGMAVAIVIGLWIRSELSFNRSISGHERIAQVAQNVVNNGEVQTWGNMPYPLADVLRQDHGEDFEHVAMLLGPGDFVVTVEEKKSKINGVYAEPAFAEILGLKMISGTRSALNEPSALLISASMANTLFGDVDPLDQSVMVGDSFIGQVQGVYEDLPADTRFADISFIAPWEGYFNTSGWVQNMDDPWRPNVFQIFVKLADGVGYADVSSRIRDAKLKRVNSELAKKKPALFLFPMDDWHLYSEFRNGVNTGGRIQYVWLFGAVGVIVLVMACINFMNMSTARSEQRSKEVGIRKAVGSQRSQLIAQFFGESIMTALMSFVLAVLLVFLSLPAFNGIAGKQMGIPWNDITFWLYGAAFVFATGLFAGSYPALYLSSLRAMNLAKGAASRAGALVIPRKALVVIQFTCSVSLVIGTTVVFRQIEFAKNREIGYERQGLIALPLDDDEGQEHFEVLRDELVGTGAILSVASASSPTTETWSTSSGFDWEGKDPDLSIDFANFGVSHDYGKTIGWEVIRGRDFSRAFISDSSAIIINEAAARYMGFSDAVGQTVRWFGQPLRVIGVVSDIVISSPYAPVKPVIYYLSPGSNRIMIVRVDPGHDASLAIATLKDAFSRHNPGYPFDYFFIDDAYERKFNDEQRLGSLSGYFSGLAVLISMLGVFGLSAFVAERRTREIGIRKILGATAVNLLAMLSREFLILVGLASLVAVPLSWYLTEEWLQTFSYRMGIPWTVFAATAGGALILTLLAVALQTFRAATMNPVKSLRSD